MKKKTVLLLALSIALILAASIDSAMAYFTSYAKAEGGYTIELGSKTTIHEDFSAWTHKVTVTNDDDSQPVYVRARAFCGSAYELVYSASDKDGLWTAGGDGYYYYNKILYPGESTSEWLVRVQNVPADVQDGDSFNVVVIYETTSVQYDQDGNPYADWKLTLDSGSSSSGEGGNP